MHNGGTVRYIGDGPDGPEFGTSGRVLSCTAAYGHVQWLEGAWRGQVGLYPAEELDSESHAHTVAASLDDSLEVGSLVSMASAQEAYEESGGEGLVSHLASTGYLASYSSVAEEAFQLIAARLQQDPVLRQLTTSMDPEEADEVYRVAARMLLSDSGDF